MLRSNFADLLVRHERPWWIDALSTIVGLALLTIAVATHRELFFVVLWSMLVVVSVAKGIIRFRRQHLQRYAPRHDSR